MTRTKRENQAGAPEDAGSKAQVAWRTPRYANGSNAEEEKTCLDVCRRFRGDQSFRQQTSLKPGASLGWEEVGAG